MRTFESVPRGRALRRKGHGSHPLSGRKPPANVLHVVGARPNFMNAAPIMAEMAKYPVQFEQIPAYTGRHYDDNMSRVFFEDLGMPQPNFYLWLGWC